MLWRKKKEPLEAEKGVIHLLYFILQLSENWKMSSSCRESSRSEKVEERPLSPEAAEVQLSDINKVSYAVRVTPLLLKG